MNKKNSSGKVYLIGAGPGDIELLTLKALRCIALADVIFIDSLVNQDVLKFAKPDAQIFPVGKRSGLPSVAQELIEEQLLFFAGQGLVVARLKGGDPFVFGRGGEELVAATKAGLEIEVVCGITSGIGAAAALGIPLTHREISHYVTFITGHEAIKDVLAEKSLVDFKGTLVIYMGLRNVRKIATTLLNYGLDKHTLCAVVQSATTEQELCAFSQLENLSETIKREQIVSPALIIVGNVVGLSPHYAKQTLATAATVGKK
ncbi:uroporphyrinogen-III C-methyltransferase [soil metagenome]